MKTLKALSFSVAGMAAAHFAVGEVLTAKSGNHNPVPAPPIAALSFANSTAVSPTMYVVNTNTDDQIGILRVNQEDMYIYRAAAPPPPQTKKRPGG